MIVVVAAVVDMQIGTYLDSKIGFAFLSNFKKRLQGCTELAS